MKTEKTKTSCEVNIDGIVGPTHNYSGLSFGNIASTDNFKLVSHPKAAAKQGLDKMRALMLLGLKQVVMPPHERPFIPLLHSLGYSGTDSQTLTQVWKENPNLLLACCSASSMWAANAATVSPSTDSQNKKVHFTPANLINYLHRSIETPTTSRILQKIFSDPSYFSHHPPLPSHFNFADEGAANHTRFCNQYGEKGLQLFVYGRSAAIKHGHLPKQFPARQTLEASQAIARIHQIPPKQVIFAQQNPAAVDAGAFHNDVISVGNQNVFFYHEMAFVNTDAIIEQIRTAMHDINKTQMHFIKVKEEQIPLKEAVRTYLFNSQLITLPDQTMALIAPKESQESIQVHAFLTELLKQKNHPIKQVIYQDVRQSMQNGGGPACLRLRVVLNEAELAHMHSEVILTDKLYEQLMGWIDTHYRDRLTLEDLADPQLLIESRQALDALTHLLKLGSLYPFQQQ